MPERPHIERVYETVLYADDVGVAAAFYAEIAGIEQIESPDEHSAAFRLADGNVLLLFNPERAGAPGRFVPSHGAAGPGHVAFHVAAVDPVAAHLRSHDVEIEREIDWPGGRSVYVRDPAGNSVEFVEGEIW